MNKKVKLVRISHRSENDGNAIDCEIAWDCVKCANMVFGLHEEIFTGTHAATPKPAFAQRLQVTMVIAQNASQLPFFFDKAVLNQAFLRAAGGPEESPCRWRVNRPSAELVVDSFQLYFGHG